MNKPAERVQAKTPYNASSPAHIRAMEAREKRWGQECIAGLRAIMGTKDGRAWMAHLLTKRFGCGLAAHAGSKMFTGNSQTFYNNALREAGDVLVAEINAVSFENYLEMQREYRAAMDATPMPPDDGEDA